MVRDHNWFLTLGDQVHKTRAVAISGILKRSIKKRERENLLSEPGTEGVEAPLERLSFA